MELKKLLGKRIQELRHKNNMKQSELAEAVGIATKSQSCIETGKNYPSAELVERYAKTFNVDIADLLTLSHIKTTKELQAKVSFYTTLTAFYQEYKTFGNGYLSSL